MENKEGQVNVVAISRIKPECIEGSRATAEKLIEATRKEEGNLRYDWFRDVKEEGVAVALECFKSMEAFQAHAGSDHIKEFGGQFKEWAAGPTVVRVLKPDNVAPKYEDGDENAVYLAAIIKGKEGAGEALKATREALIEATRKDKGTLRYDWFQDVKEAGVYVILECFASMQVFQAHLQREEFKEFMGKAKEWADGEPEVRVLRPEYVAKK